VADIRPTTVLAYPYPLAASALTVQSRATWRDLGFWRHPGARGSGARLLCFLLRETPAGI